MIIRKLPGSVGPGKMSENTVVSWNTEYV